jgi:putative phage-type endonuclease
MSLVFHYDKDLPMGTELKRAYLAQQVVKLQGIFQPEQRTKEWYDMRENMLTASDWGTVLGENHYSNANSVLMKKCGDNTFFKNAAMEWGNKYESVAVLVYEHRNQKKVLEFGCLKHPSIDFLGASPDGITTDGVMLEIKCPSSRKITGIPPSYYWCQVQGQLEVCELDRCDFLECSIKEYENEEQYLNDHYENNYLMNQFGNEKGVVVEFYNKMTKTFYFDYSPVCIISEQLEKWKKDIVESHVSNTIIFSCFYYWYLEEVSCVPIYRNQEWFHKAKVELELFWKKVLKYRILGLDKLKEDIQMEKDEKKNKLTSISEEEKGKEKEKKEKKPRKTSISKKQKKENNTLILDFIHVEKKEEDDEDLDNIEISKTSLFTVEEDNKSDSDHSNDYSDEDLDNIQLSKTSLFS